ncbi:uncharacterized protein LOC128212418 isoform X1 [Mya arenaria]|uniref:uncharacterized protein LOC128212418 isoform X1 n=1 Tax=Mya arenaria TaxID=6604 RepID=UPI0022E01D32|nr:uncharacterized protein LOC128212418 isoform X1 [Mya arenaria]
MAALNSVFVLILSTVGLVRSSEWCGDFSYCDEGYCCEDGTSCCTTNLGVGGYVGVGFGILVFFLIIAAIVRCCSLRHYLQPLYVQQALPGTNVTAVNTATARYGATISQGASGQTRYMSPPPTGQAGYMPQHQTRQARFVNPMAASASCPPSYSK